MSVSPCCWRNSRTRAVAVPSVGTKFALPVMAKVHLDDLADLDRGRGFVNVMHAISGWEVEVPIAFAARHRCRHVGAVSYLPTVRARHRHRNLIAAGRQQQCWNDDSNSRHCGDLVDHRSGVSRAARSHLPARGREFIGTWCARKRPVRSRTTTRGVDRQVLTCHRVRRSLECAIASRGQVVACVSLSSLVRC